MQCLKTSNNLSTIRESCFGMTKLVQDTLIAVASSHGAEGREMTPCEERTLVSSTATVNTGGEIVLDTASQLLEDINLAEVRQVVLNRLDRSWKKYTLFCQPK